MDSTPRRALPPSLSVLACASGAAALSLELLWARRLALVLGSSHLAVTITLAAFMLGLGLGSSLGGRLADRTGKPLLRLAAVEGAMAVIGPLLTIGIGVLPEALHRLTPAGTAETPAFTVVKFAVAFLSMLPATILMGMTFPLLIRSVEPEIRTIHKAVAVLYGWNTLGGVLGVIFASFVLLPTRGIPGVMTAAAGFNVIAAVIGWWLSFRSNPVDSPGNDASPVEAGMTRFLLLAALSGGLVLGAETLWNRILGIVLPNSTYTFALILTIYLFGMALGGFAASIPAVSRRNPLRLWATIQGLAAGWVLVSILFLPEISRWVRLLRPPTGWGRVLATPITVGAALVFPGVLLLGAAWPLLLNAATRRTENSGRTIGRMGLTNAVGAAAGAFLVGWWLLPALGAARSMIVLAGCHLVAASLGAPPKPRRPLRLAVPAGALLLFILAAAIGPFAAVGLPSTATPGNRWITRLYREGPAGTVTVLEDPSTGSRSMFVDNNAVIGTTFDALKVVRMLGLLPALLHPEPADVLVIGYGAGVTTATLEASPAVGSIDVVEIIPEVVEASPLFEPANHDVLDSPRVDLRYGDGRNFLLFAEKRWDVITCDPVHPLYGSAPLYSLEYFELCRRRLNPEGLLFQYLPLHQMPPDAFRRTIGAFASVFPNAQVAFSMGHGVLIGSIDPIVLDWDRWSERLSGFRHPADLVDSALSTPAQIAAVMQLDSDACRAVGLRPYSTDSHPTIEFLEPAAFEPGVWKANARTLIEAYRSPLDSIERLPPDLVPALQRLIAGKRLLLFSQLERNEGDGPQAAAWLRKAATVAPGDPEIIRFAEQASREGWLPGP